jgi:FKBP-type peptidyl-prolyl cis-trans isomerase 2
MSPKKMIFTAIAAVLLAAIMAGCSSPAAKTAIMGDNVSINYILTSSNGTVLDTSFADVAKDAGIYDPTRDYAPYNFIVGDEMVIEGVSDAVVGMKAGETKNATITPDKAYGEYNVTFIQPVNMSDLTAANITPYVNQTLTTLFGTVRVDSIDVNNSTVYIDYNHPLAGQTLKA